MAAGVVARFGRSVKAVGWSFLGIRSKAGQEGDHAGLKPLEVVAVGLIGVFVLIGALATLVNWVVSK
jgi:predicted Na+-dependent transporter